MSWAEERSPGELEFSAADPNEVETHLIGVLAACGSRVVSLSPVRPGLEEVFLSLTMDSGDQGAGVR